jgi:hypothetical protein
MENDMNNQSEPNRISKIIAAVKSLFVPPRVRIVRAG